MKTTMGFIKTKKHVNEIINAFRSKSFQLDMIPSEVLNGKRSSFAAILRVSGGGMLGGRNEPGIKVVIYDFGNSRSINIEALSTSPMGQKFNLKKGEQLCNQIYSEMNEEMNEEMNGESESADVEHTTQEIEAAKISTPEAVNEHSIDDTNHNQEKKDDFANEFKKGFKDYNSASVDSFAVKNSTESVATRTTTVIDEEPKPDYIKPSVSVDEDSTLVEDAKAWRCEKCGKINVGDSKFCGNCGNPKLEQNRIASDGDTTSARSKSSNPSKPVNKTLAIVAVIVVLTLIVGIPVMNRLSTSSLDGGYYDEEYTDDSYDSYDEDEDYVEPIYAEASSQRDAMGDIYYYPENVIDNDVSTAWVEGVDGDGIGEWISVTFSNVNSMKGLRIRNGYQKSFEVYNTNNRVKDAYVEFEDGTIDKFKLDDINNNEQVVLFSEEKPGNKFKLIIKSVYHSDDIVDTCITELNLVTTYGTNEHIIQAERVR